MNAFVAQLKKEHAAFAKAEADTFAKAQEKKHRSFMASQKRQLIKIIFNNKMYHKPTTVPWTVTL